MKLEDLHYLILRHFEATVIKKYGIGVKLANKIMEQNRMSRTKPTQVIFNNGAKTNQWRKDLFNK